MGSKRFHTIDTARGFLLLHMIVFHFLWDMVYIFGASMPWFCGAGANIWANKNISSDVKCLHIHKFLY